MRQSLYPGRFISLYDMLYDEFEVEDCEVIGNIHDNPELLEATNE